VVERYRVIVEGLKLSHYVLPPIAADLEARVASDASHEDAYVDNLKAAGEDHCARVFAAYLAKLGHEVHYVNPRDAGLLLSDEPGNARVLQSSYGRVRTHLGRLSGILVFPGFFGYSESGRVVTFPRGGSDITGAILAAAMDADVYEITDVMASSSSIRAGRVTSSKVTYREMRELVCGI
jgi:aspartate kinase